MDKIEIQYESAADDLAQMKPEKPKLLVIDDQAVNVRLIHGLFQSDFDVYMATNGKAGITKCKSLLPDIILLDVVMEGMTGYDVCRELKADPALKHIPVIFITGQFNEQDEVHGFEIGAVDFIHKPINPIITKARVKTHTQHKLQNDVLRNIAMLDGLTGIANRRRFDTEYGRMWRHCARENQILSLIIIDIDYFKQYNDFYGHLEGDSILREIAHCIKSVIGRPQDLVARVGGEEFALLLPNTPKKNTSTILDRLLKKISSLDLAHEKSPLGRLSVSAGCSSIIPNNAEITDILFRQADTALYNAKQQGRNQYRFFQEGT